MTDRPYTLVTDIAQAIPVIQPDSIVSHTLFGAEGVKAVLFGFAPGQELSEHTSSKAAILHIVQGRAQLTLGDDSVEAHAGTIVHMPAHLPHSVHAETEVLMILHLLQR